MNESIHITHNKIVRGTAGLLPSSKSISNRTLILNALSGNQSVVSNLSSARDTALMTKLIGNLDTVIDVMDAGTTMRFLTAYFAATGAKKIITGTDRMKQRPLALLVNALREIGAEIFYMENEGFPPIEIKGFGSQKASAVSIPGDVSSQYISALMMIAPVLPLGLTITLVGKIGSRPYIEMTASLMRDFGISADFSGQTIHIPPSSFKKTAVTVEADWSAASYWYAFTALAESAEISLPNVSRKSLQGDRVIVELMEKLGVKSSFIDSSVVLTKQPHVNELTWDFADCPDLAQTVLPVCAAKGVKGMFTGLDSLRIKETDRITALQNELAKIGATLTEISPGTCELTPGSRREKITIDTYHDHRMAMGLAPLATLIDLDIVGPEVVNKSYPGFWEDMKSVGFVIH